MKAIIKPLLAASVMSLALTQPVKAVDHDDLIAVLQDYMEMAAFGDGVITADQLKAMMNEQEIFIIDARQEQDFNQSHIPGAVNIDWRYVLSDLDQIPDDKMIVLYCDTGILSSKAHMALRLVGYDQARVLFNGYSAWSE
ncbi:rhodanese-like domain-containing protein [Thiomicrospira cyclica]|uniref:Rhodanese-like protein n=1 Tax=Thiomicrospira cyclica (strain DSM 14477 / JCM 11371 / ALM1) TaxID=717773 RepID=F6DB99_THICA|nr:rhodanese-like domain-containing protein [Thiomicrospira cyclica]AEG31207.1 Rhodanese-like protein [Thiomicrospira cyclica ALM1]